MKLSIFNIQILSFSNGHEMINFEGSVNLTFEMYCRDPVTSFYSIKNKFICLDFLRVRPKFMKLPIFNIKILSFSNGHEMKIFERSVNLTFEMYCRDPVTSFYSSKNKFLCLDFLRVRPKFMKLPIFNIKILSFSNGHEMKNFEGSVNLTFEIYFRGTVKYCSCI